MILLIVCSALTGLVYALMIAAFIKAWLKNRHTADKRTAATERLRLSVVVAIRNEAHNLPDLLQHLLNQVYANYEVIIVDDHSIDNSWRILQQVSEQESKLIAIQLTDSLCRGKKQAIKKALSKVSGQLIVQTDADCRMSVNWLSSVAVCYEQYQCKMVIAPVIMWPLNKLFDKLQALEFLSLIASGLAAAALRHPIMCNGANLAYEKKALDHLTDPLNEKFASGDDVFLMTAVKRQFSDKEIYPLFARESIVWTKPEPTLMAFIRQRLRWTSKSKGYQSFDIILSAIIVLLINLLLFGLLVAACFQPVLWCLFVTLFVVKSIPDAILLSIANQHFYHNQKLMWWFVPLQIMYPIYISLIGVLGQFLPYRWKSQPSARKQKK